MSITQPISANGVYYIYTAADLAWLQGKDVANVVIKNDIDLGGHSFTPIKKVANLDGENHIIYDLYIDIIHDGYMGAGFIALAEGTTTHKNLIFERANIRCLHNPAIGEGQSTAGNAYAGTLLGTASYATYTCENVHCRHGNIYAVCKIGGLFGRTMYGNITVKNCTVDGYNIENYDPGVKEDSFVSYGEVGGFIGFIDAEQATIEGCSVTNTVINAKHYAGAGSLLPGRHVNQFIGDIRTHTAETRIYLNSNSVSGNSYTGNSDRHSYLSGWKTVYVDIIGLCYYVWTSEGKGQVFVDGTKVFG